MRDSSAASAACLALALCATACAAPEPATCSRVSGTICTVAGTGVAGDGADNLFPLATMLYSPADVTIAPDGRLVIVDWNNHRIRMVKPDGRLKIVAGEGELATGAFVDEVSDRLNHPTDVIFDRQGRMVIAAWHNSRIKRLDLGTGKLDNIAGTGARSYGGDNGPALDALLNLPASVVLDADDNLIFSDQANQRLRKLTPAGIISTIAGSGRRGFEGDAGHALEASFKLPVGQQGHPAAHLARDAAGNMYLADTENNRIRRIGADGVVSTVAGNGNYGASGDGGDATAAELAGPVDVAIGPGGDLFIADSENNCVRALTGGKIRTVAGTCGACTGDANDHCRCQATDAACLGDGRPARSALLARPTGIAFDQVGNLFIADTLDHRIRVVWR